MTRLIITGTSTEVGKTIVTAGLAAVVGSDVTVVKVAQTGVAPDEDGDLAVIRRLAGIAKTIEFARYPDPLAPETAAMRAGRALLELDDVVAQLRAIDTPVLIEGAGGLLVRLGANGFTVVDIARALEAPVLIVASAGLGTLNHTALTVQSLRHSSVACAGIVIGSWPREPDLAAQCNRGDLCRVTNQAVVGVVPEGAGSLAPEAFQSAAPGWFDRSLLDRVRFS